MNDAEKRAVSRLVTRLAQAPEAPKDPEAQRELDALLRLRPDAPYQLMQRTLMLEAALEAAQARLQRVDARAHPAPADPSSGLPAAAPAAPAGASAWPSTAPMPHVWGMMPGMSAAPAAPATTGAAVGRIARDAVAVGAGVLGGGLLLHGVGTLLQGGDATDPEPFDLDTWT